MDVLTALLNCNFVLVCALGYYAIFVGYALTDNCDVSSFPFSFMLLLTGLRVGMLSEPCRMCAMRMVGEASLTPSVAFEASQFHINKDKPASDDDDDEDEEERKKKMQKRKEEMEKRRQRRERIAQYEVEVSQVDWLVVDLTCLLRLSELR